MGIPHIPILRRGEEYRSLDVAEVRAHATGEVLAHVSQANAGIVRRDLRRMTEASDELRQLTVARMIEICKAAGDLFLNAALPLNEEGDAQSPDDYVHALSQTSGLPHTLCKANMRKVFTVFDEMADILRGLTRGMDPAVIDGGTGEHSGIPVSYGPTTAALGVVLPSNSPGVNSIWMPSVALKTPVVLKPGREEPWTPARVMAAFIAAGCPRAAFSFYPTDHEGSAAILEHCGRALLFGDEATTKGYANNAAVQIHGPGRSKVIIGADEIERWRDHLDVLVASVADNGGRSCINASSIFVPAHADEVADELARALAGIEPRAADDPDARLSAFANPKFAEYVDNTIDAGVSDGGAEDVTAKHRQAPRARQLDGAEFVSPTVVRCQSVEHPLARTEFLFPFVSVVEVPNDELVTALGPSLVVTALTRDEALLGDLLASAHVDRVNIGPIPTSRVEWDQPHEGNLFEFLYQRRAIQRVDGW